jgi:hypothetical protein
MHLPWNVINAFPQCRIVALGDLTIADEHAVRWAVVEAIMASLQMSSMA